jgi:hypothetical protein
MGLAIHLAFFKDCFEYQAFLGHAMRVSIKRQRSNTLDRLAIIAHPQYQTFLGHAMRVFIKILQVFEAKAKYHRQVGLAIIAHPQYQTFLDHAMRVFIKILQVFETKIPSTGGWLLLPILSIRPSWTMPCGSSSRSSRYSGQRLNTIDRWLAI